MDKQIPKNFAQGEVIYSECVLRLGPSHIWLVSKMNNETVRHCLSFLVYTSNSLLSLPKNSRIQLPLKT